MFSFAAHKRFEDELGADPRYERIGFQRIGSERATPELRENHALLQRKGVDSQLLDREGIAAQTPGLNL